MTPDYPQIPKSTTIRFAFARETSVGVAIHAHPSIIWTLLTTAHDIARWTSTILSLEGDIRPGRTIRLRSSLAPKRTFTLTVKEFVPERKLVWGDGQGTRTFTLESTGGLFYSLCRRRSGECCSRCIGAIFHPLMIPSNNLQRT